MPRSSLATSSRMPSAPTPVWKAQNASIRVGRELERQRVGLDDRVVVAQGLPLLESHGAGRASRGRQPRQPPCDRRRPDPPARGRSRRSAARPRAFASTSAGAGRSCGVRRFMPSTSPASSSSKPERVAGRARDPGGLGRAAPRPRRPRPPWRPRARRWRRRGPRAPWSGPPAASGGACRPSIAASRRPGAAGSPHLQQLERAHQALAVARVDLGRQLRRPAGQVSVQRRRSRCASSRARSSGGGGGARSSWASAARRYSPVPPTTIGVAARLPARRPPRRARAPCIAPPRTPGPAPRSPPAGAPGAPARPGWAPR